jgi:hypothetical protein
MATRRSSTKKTAQTGFASLDAVEEYAESATPAQIRCRDIRHPWEPFKAHEVKGGGYYRIMRCPFCHTEWHQELSPNGIVVSSRYKYAPGYLMPKGFGRISTEDKGVLRVASTVQMMLNLGKG